MVERVSDHIRAAGISDVVVWDNSARLNSRVYGRYLAIGEALHPVIYTQDDDCEVDVLEVIRGYQAGFACCNMPAEFRPHYTDGIALVGFGAVFDRWLPSVAFERYMSRWTPDEIFTRECDRVFTKMTPTKLLAVAYSNYPEATGGDRMYKEQRHFGDLVEIRRRLDRLLELETMG